MGSLASASISAPVALAASHVLDRFTCAEPALTDWLIRRARKNEEGGASRTYVVCEGHDVVGYYCLAAGAADQRDAPGGIRRNMPSPIPVLVLGRLATKAGYEGRGIATGLLKDAVLRSQQAAALVGVRALLCHAISEEAKKFYLKRGFEESPVAPMTVMLKLSLPSPPTPAADDEHDGR